MISVEMNKQRSKVMKVIKYWFLALDNKTKSIIILSLPDITTAGFYFIKILRSIEPLRHKIPKRRIQNKFL
jgi:hypothetical protein